MTRTTFRATRARRPAFTLVEMLVATALILFIMVILSEAFKAGLDSFRQLKAVGDLEERMRTATAQLRKDLSADHFEGRRKLSDPNFWLQPPREGFFQVVQASGRLNVDPTQNIARTGRYQNWLEGADISGGLTGISSFRAVDHRLHFAVKLRGNQQEKFFSTSIPTPSLLPGLSTTFFNQSPDSRFEQAGGSVYNSPWAEVAYYLVEAGTTAGSRTKLYSLYRCQLVVLPDNRQVNWDPTTGNPRSIGALSDYPGFSCQITSNYLFFNTPTDLANGTRALDTELRPLVIPAPAVVSGLPNMASRSTVLMTDVISFDVQVLKRDTAGNLRLDFEDLPRGFNQSGNLPPTGTAPVAAIFDTRATLPLTPYFYGHPQALGNPAVAATRDNYNVVAVQITLRVWDPKTEQARQITVVQDL